MGQLVCQLNSQLNSWGVSFCLYRTYQKAWNHIPQNIREIISSAPLKFQTAFENLPVVCCNQAHSQGVRGWGGGGGLDGWTTPPPPPPPPRKKKSANLQEFHLGYAPDRSLSWITVCEYWIITAICMQQSHIYYALFLLIAFLFLFSHSYRARYIWRQTQITTGRSGWT